jgi:hypothetical protein
VDAQKLPNGADTKIEKEYGTEYLIYVKVVMNF